jgi:pyruvate kinase
MKKTKIVCTIGPSSEKIGVLKKMLKSGMDAVRLNFSHGDKKSHRRVIRNLRGMRKISDNIPIIADTKGPEIRTGDAQQNVELKEGSEFILTTKKILGNEKGVSVSYEKLPQKVKKGNTILLNDGKIKLKVKATEKKNIVCKVIDGGILKSKSGVNIPRVDLGIKSPTKKDIEDIKFAVDEDVDFIAISHVKSGRDVEKVRKLIRGGKEGDDNGIRIISKIEHFKALENLDEIIDVSDGIMVARGDLGVEAPLFDVPLLQKEIIKKCNLAAKPVIVATQMLLSMIENKKPTRAEVSDVANAVLDGADAVMLSEETASGKYPILALRTMRDIVSRAEKNITGFVPHVIKTKSKTVSALISKNVWQSTRELDLKCIITHTKSGFTARNISKFRPKIPIYAFTTTKKVYRQLNLSWGVKSFLVEKKESMDEMLEFSIRYGLKSGLFKEDDRVIVTAGLPLYTSGTTNFMEIQRAGRFLRKKMKKK